MRACVRACVRAWCADEIGRILKLLVIFTIIALGAIGEQIFAVRAAVKGCERQCWQGKAQAAEDEEGQVIDAWLYGLRVVVLRGRMLTDCGRSASPV